MLKEHVTKTVSQVHRNGVTAEEISHSSPPVPVRHNHNVTPAWQIYCMASHKGLRTGLDPFERFKPLFLVAVTFKEGKTTSRILKEEKHSHSPWRERKGGEIWLSTRKVRVQGITPLCSSGYYLAVLFGMSMNPSPSCERSRPVPAKW